MAGVAVSGKGSPKKPAKAGASASRVWLQGLACGALLMLSTPTALLGALLFAPSAVAALLDGSTGRMATRPMLLWGAAASIRPMVVLWTGVHSNAQALALAGDVQVLGLAWAAQAGGWLVAEILPLFIAIGLNTAAAAQTLRLRHERRRYAAEWDLPDISPDEPDA